MKRPADTRLVAMQFECVGLIGNAKEGRYSNLYAVENVPGVFRRVAMSPGTLPDDHLLADFGDREIELVRATDVEAELKVAGYVRVSVNVGKLRPAERSAVLASLFDPDAENEEGDESDAEPDDDDGSAVPDDIPDEAKAESGHDDVQERPEYDEGDEEPEESEEDRRGRLWPQPDG